MRHLLVSALWILSAGVATAAAPSEAPREFVRDMADRVLVVLKNDSLDSDAKVAAIEEVAYARFDFDTISRLVLARNWRKLDAKQQEDFTREFKKHLTVTYGDNINSYANETVDITGDREEPRGDWTVQTKIVRGSSSEDIFVDYRLRPRDGEWKVIDVVVERISLVSNFRSQLQEIISREGADAMIAKLAAKNASGESLFPEEEARSRR